MSKKAVNFGHRSSNVDMCFVKKKWAIEYPREFIRIIRIQCDAPGLQS